VKQSKAPGIESLSELNAAESFFAVAEVCVPNATLESLSFGVDESVKKGSIVWVSLKGRKKPLLALALDVHKNFPKFKLKPAVIFSEGRDESYPYVFSERYLETLHWCANYYMCSLGEALTAFWPAELEKYLKCS
jgi:primosomal protein N'